MYLLVVCAHERSADQIVTLIYLCMVLCVKWGVYDLFFFFFFQAEDGIRDLVRSRGLGDVYKRQERAELTRDPVVDGDGVDREPAGVEGRTQGARVHRCLLYTSDAADERSSVDLGGRRIIKKKKKAKNRR